PVQRRDRGNLTEIDAPCLPGANTVDRRRLDMRERKLDAAGVEPHVTTADGALREAVFFLAERNPREGAGRGASQRQREDRQKPHVWMVYPKPDPRGKQG